ncbi:MAG: 2-hydroxyacyl-CoA dehydratase family protein [Promethearchaeota archaeon]
MIYQSFLDIVRKHRPSELEDLDFIGCYGHQYCPDVILASLGLKYLNLIVGGNEYWQTRGMDYLTPTSCVYSREIIGLFEHIQENRQHGFNISTIIHTNYCSGDYHSGEVLQHYFGVKAIPFTIPYKFSPHGFNLVISNIQQFIKELEKEFNVTSDPENLMKKIIEYNEICNEIKEFAKVPVYGLQRIEAYMEIELAPWEKKLALVKKIIENFKSQKEKNDTIRERLNFIITGSPLMIGDKFLSLLDNLEISIRFYDFHFADERAIKKIPFSREEVSKIEKSFNLEVDETNPIHLLAIHFLNNIAPERMVQYKENHLIRRADHVDKYRKLLDESESIHGIINHVLKFCDVYGTNRDFFKTYYQKTRNIPVLNIERDFSSSSTGQMTTRLEAFLEMIIKKK